MPRRIPVSADQLEYLKTAVESETSTREMAAVIGCCEDTLKRILMRHNLAFFEGAKYVVSQTHRTTKWKRPCMICKSTRPRPKLQYVCDRCKETRWNDGLDWRDLE